MPEKKQPPIHQTAIGNDNIQVVGSNNIITRITNFFAGDKETTDQRNRRIMLGHVENFWVKGILEKSLHGAALLELGIKEDPDALTYPWAIKREATKETLPAGMSMLEIFEQIGMGRSLLILGAPGSGKTTMLLELTRQLIQRASEDVTEPIPMVFNLASWTEKLTLADWLSRELNTIYYVPKKVAPIWVKENRMLLLLDGLDDVKQESRDKCVETINQFRKENGLTSIVVSSRIQDYAQLKTRLSFDGAIEIQLLTLKQVDEYFKPFGKGLTGIKQVLKKDAILQEMAETPLFLSIMILAYRHAKSTDIFIPGNSVAMRKQLFKTYIERMLGRPEPSNNEKFNSQDVLRWLSWLAQRMIAHNQIPYLLERMQPTWLENAQQSRAYQWCFGLMTALLGGLIGVGLGLSGLGGGLYGGLLGAAFGGQIFVVWNIILKPREIEMVDRLKWLPRQRLGKLLGGVVVGLIVGLIIGLIIELLDLRVDLLLKVEAQHLGLKAASIFGLFLGLIFSLASSSFNVEQIEETTGPGQHLRQTLFSAVSATVWLLLIIWMSDWLGFGLIYGFNRNGLLIESLLVAFVLTFTIGGIYGLRALLQHYALRFILIQQGLLPRRLVPFLNHCADLIFLRRVGGGYIFVHRLLMEHFADMYPANEK